MSDNASAPFFLVYLTCDVPMGYPMKSPLAKLLVPSPPIASRREMLHQQSDFLDLAKGHLGTSPWIAYLAAIKHEAVLVAIPTYAPQLVDIVDQFFFTELQQKGQELLDAARAAIDEPTAQDCDRLVLLQSEAVPIENAIKSINGAIQGGFTAVEPLPPPPPEPPTGFKSLPRFVAAAVASMVIGAMIPFNYGGMAWALAGLIVTGIIAARVLKKEKSETQAKGAEFKAYMLHEGYYTLCKKSVGLVLALPFEIRKTALVNLPPCLTALKALGPEREALEARYIRPFVS